jgi:hypothetical protein
MDAGTRMALINQMGFTMGDYTEAMRASDWALARRHLNKLVAAFGMLAVEIEENDPVEREN